MAKPTHVHSVKDGQKFSGDTALVTVECNSCFITYAIPESLYEAALKWRGDRIDGRGWKLSCPVGHTWWYVGESAEERLQRRLEESERRAQATRDLLAAEERSHRATRGHVTRAKKRAVAGVCPSPGCHRHFADLERHVASKHPDLVEKVRDAQA